MHRRESLKYVATMLGLAFSAPTVLAMENYEKNIKLPNYDFSFTEDARKLVSVVAEMIIPKTNTPGAIDVGVPAFIETMLRDCYKYDDQYDFMLGVAQIIKNGFLDLDGKGKTEALKKIEAESKQNRTSPSFWRLTKELTLIGYFTSEAGIKASFDYNSIPGKFEPIKLKPGQKAYAY